MYNKSTAIEYLENTFPHLAEDLHDEIADGLFHAQMAVFSRWAQKVIACGDRAAWEQVTKAFLALWKGRDAEVENALNVSFLENLKFSDGKREMGFWAYEAMPAQMQRAWDEMEEYNRKIHGG